MKDPTLKYKVSHVLIRFITIAQITYLLVGTFSKRFYEASKLDSDWDAILWIWLMASLLVLPFFVGLESLWYLAARSDGRGTKEGASILIDAGMVLVWMATMFAFVLWSMWHPAWI